MQVAGSAIDRVFHPPSVPVRRFAGVIDAAFTLAIGSVCAFGLTLGPAPLNTVGVSSAAAAGLAPAASSTMWFTPAAAIRFVEAYRLDAGLDAFVPAEACADLGMHATVPVTPLSPLSPELVDKSLVPDPAYATVSGEPGAVSVIIHACQ